MHIVPQRINMAVRKKKKAAVGPATSSKAKVHPKHSAKRQGQTKRKIKTSRKKRTATPTQSFRFLALPAEIRNSIYELALKSSTPILVERKLKSPPLLSTCTQIRSKAASIWYRDNKFYARVPNCDAAAVNKWSQHCCTVGQRDYFDVAIKLFGGIEWSNLLKWCQAVWEDDRARRLAWQAGMLVKASYLVISC